jgi:predicted transcriptional regulator
MFGIGLEVKADKTKYMVISRDQNAGQIRNTKIDSSSFQRVEEFKYLGTNLTNQNSIEEEIKSRLKSLNACYHSVQNPLSSSLLSKNIKIKIYRTTIMPVFCVGVKLGRSH